VSIVIDASMTLALCFEDEAPPEADRIVDHIARNGAVAPAHWALELANGLVMAERRGRLKPADAASFVELLRSLPIEIDADTAAQALRDTLALARAQRLTSYDAAYLELAMRRGLPLVTLDAPLEAAASRLGTPTTLPA